MISWHDGTLGGFHELRRRGRQATEAGRLDEAVSLFDRASSWAEENGEQDLADLAFCGRSAAAIELDGGEGDGTLARLRAILMRNREDENCFLAAYNVARVYDLRKEYRKALFYARIAKDRAQRLGRAEWLASSHNQMGNLLLAESFFDDAREEYQAALDHLPEEPSIRQALIFDNLGYCAVVQGRHRDGFRQLFHSLRTLRRFGARRYTVQPQMGLCFAYMEIDRPRRALAHGLAALTLAEEMADRAAIKNCLYLLGEAAHLTGDVVTARRTFARLQNEFFPEAGFLPDFLMAIDVRRLVNLRA